MKGKQKMKRIVIFGTGIIAQLADFYFDKDSAYEVAAFTADKQFIEKDTFMEKPVVAAEDVNRIYPPDEFAMFIALSYSKMNTIRESKYLEAKEKGYDLVSYISSKATIWAEQSIGDNCFILEDNTIQPYATIGNNVTLWSGNHIGHHSSTGDNTFISSHVVVSGNVTIGKNCFLGVNSTFRDGISIADFTLVGAGCYISRNIDEPESVYTIPPAVLHKKKSFDLL